MFLNIREFSYGQIKQLIEQENDYRLRLLYRFEFFMIVCYYFRCIAIIIMLRWPDILPLYRFDNLALFVWVYRDIYNEFVVFILSLMAILCLLGLREFYLCDKQTFVFRAIYDLMVRNFENYRKCLKNPIAIKDSIELRRQIYLRQRMTVNGLIIPMSIFSRYCWLKAWLDSWIEIDFFRLDRQMFIKNPMKIFDKTPVRTRVYLVQCIIIQNGFFFIFHLFACKFYNV